MVKENNAPFSVQESSVSISGETQSVSYIPLYKVGTAEDKTDEMRDSIAAVQRDTDPTNLGRSIGVVLRKVWDAATSWFGLDDINEKDEVAKDEIVKSSSDAQLEQAIEKMTIRVNTDVDVTKDELDHIKSLKENVKNGFRIAANRGPKTRELIIECLENVPFEILDPKYSKDTIEKLTQESGMQYQALYNDRSKEIKVVSFFGGQYVSSVLVHECSHARDYSQGIMYDATLLEECLQNVHETTALSQYYISGIKELRSSDRTSANYDIEKNHIDKLSGEKSVSTPMQCELESEDVITSKLHEGKKEMISQFVYDQDSGACILDMSYSTDVETGKRQEVTPQQKLAHDFIMSEYDLGLFIEQTKRSKLLPVQKAHEMHAGLQQNIGEKMLDENCPKGFGKQTVGVDAMKKQMYEEYCDVESNSAHPYCKSLKAEKLQNTKDGKEFNGNSKG